MSFEVRNGTCMTIKIEKDIPFQRVSWGSYTGVFEIMEVGDSFELPIKKWASIRELASRYSKKHNYQKRFVVRRTGEETVRCWRVK